MTVRSLDIRLEARGSPPEINADDIGAMGSKVYIVLVYCTVELSTRPHINCDLSGLLDSAATSPTINISST